MKLAHVATPSYGVLEIPPEASTVIQMDNGRTPEQQTADEIGAKLLALFLKKGMTYAELIEATGVSQSTLRRIFRVDDDWRDLRLVDYSTVSKALGEPFGRIVVEVEQARDADGA